MENRKDKVYSIEYMNQFGDLETIQGNANHPFLINMAPYTLFKLTIDNKSIQFLSFPNDTIVFSDNRSLKYHYKQTKLNELDTAFLKKVPYLLKETYANYTKGAQKFFQREPNAKEGIRVIEFVNSADAANFYKQSKIMYIELNNLLDSLENAGKIKPEYVSVYKTSNVANFLENLCALSRLDKNAKWENFIFENKLLSDSLLFYDVGNYKKILRNDFITTIICKDKYARISGNEISVDYKLAFDSSSNYLSGQLLDIARVFCLSKIREKENEPVFSKYLMFFLDSTKSAEAREYVNAKFSDKFPANNVGMLLYQCDL